MAVRAAGAVGAVVSGSAIDKISAWKLSPALAPVWRIVYPTVSPAPWSVRVTGPNACQPPVAVWQTLTLCAADPVSCNSRQILRPATPSTCPAAWNCSPASTPAAGLGEAYML